MLVSDRDKPAPSESYNIASAQNNDLFHSLNILTEYNEINFVIFFIFFITCTFYRTGNVEHDTESIVSAIVLYRSQSFQNFRFRIYVFF